MKDISVDARLEAVFVVRESVEVEVEETFAVALMDGRGEEESKEVLLVVRVRMAEEASEEPEGSHFDGRLEFADSFPV